MALNIDLIAENLTKKDTRAIAKAISICENNQPGAEELLNKIFPFTGKAKLIGITGTPGSGKSTLVDQMAIELRKRGKTVAIIAVDPSSPFSGGAVLGDRIRMSNATEDFGIFMRSLAARGALGGLSQATNDTVHILDAAGFDVILIETVGVGQAEVEIVHLADTCLVVVVPGLGDGVQAVKAGVLEIADIFVVNKYDRDGADQVHRDIRNMLGLVTYEESEWKPELVDTIATLPKGVDSLIDKIFEHQNWLEQSGNWVAKRYKVMQTAIINFAKETYLNKIISNSLLQSLTEECLSRKITPREAARKLG
jgi:LAO/AO transport system kinase